MDVSSEGREVAMPVTARKRSLQLEPEDGPSNGLRLEDKSMRSNGYLVLLSLGFAGLQTVFALLSSNGSSYLIHLGMSKSLLGLTWLAGPIAGAVLQPYIGLCSDRCRSAMGRRRPYILSGSLVIILATILLAQTSELASVIACQFGVHAAEHSIRICLAVVAMICITCGIQPVQVGLRALIVDRCPSSQQLQANAWAARATGIGNIFCFLIGTMNLPALFPALRDQFNALSLVACICLAITTGTSSLFVSEDTMPDRDRGSCQPSSFTRRVREIFESGRTLPNDIKTVCIVQFFSWIGWFPFLFYISTYASETYLRRSLNATGDDQDSITGSVWDDATRQGSATMLIFAIVSFISSALLPILLGNSRWLSMARKDMMISRPKSAISLRSAWAASQSLFGLCLIVSGLFANDAVIKVCAGLIGISWACTIWIPFAMISTSIAARNSRALIDEVEGPLRLEPATVLALHNVALCVPQALTACLSSFIFWIFTRQKTGIPLILGIGGLSGLAAAWFTRSLKTDQVIENAMMEESIHLVPGHRMKTYDEEEDARDDLNP